MNWPKGFFVEGLVPNVAGSDGKTRLRTLLSRQRVPRGTESKYVNTLEFFDHVYEAQGLSKFDQATPSPAASEVDAIP